MSPIRLKKCSGPCQQSYPFTHFWSDAGAPDGRMSRCPACEKQARIERAEAKARGELGNGKPDRNGRVVTFTEEERKRRSEKAKELIAQGRFGGAVNGAKGGKAIGRHRISDAVLEHFRDPDKQALVIKAYESNLKGKSKRDRLAAAEALLRQEKIEDERMSRDRGGAVDPASMSQEELMAFIEQGLASMIESGQVPTDIVLNDSDVQEL